mgnify:FL=1
MEVTPLTRKKTGTTIRWLPDLEVFTDIDIPLDYYQDVMKRQAVVNAGVTFRLRSEVSPGRFETQDFLYENGIRDYLAELAGDDPITRPVCWEAERQGRDRADKPEYKVKLNIAWCFSNRVHLMEHYHNSSFLEHGGSPTRPPAWPLWRHWTNISGRTTNTPRAKARSPFPTCRSACCW